MSLSFPASPTANQIYQGWKWNGAAWDPNYAANFVTSLNGQKGDVTGLPQLLATNNVVNAAMCSFVLPVATYKRYQIRFDSLVALTTSTTMGLQVSNNGGSTWDNAADYNWATVFMNTGGSVPGATSGVGSNLAAIFGSLDMAGMTGMPGSGRIDFMINAAGRFAGTSAVYCQTSGGTGYALFTGFQNPILANQNAIRLVEAAGNITVNATLYGFP